MAELWFDPEADASLRVLEADAKRAKLLRAVNAVLDQLEADSGDASVRKIRFQAPALWCVTIVADRDEWAVLWEPHPTEVGDVMVHYVGPASFA